MNLWRRRVVVCGVDLTANKAVLAIVQTTPDGSIHIPCQTKRLILGDDRDVGALEIMRNAIGSFAHQNAIEIFVIKARMATGRMASGGVSFKIETLFQLSGVPVGFVSAQALARFGKTNMGGVPSSVLAYQEDAFKCGALYLASV